MDPSKVDLAKIPQDVRLRILEYVTKERGVKPKQLGVTATYIYKIRKGEKRVSDKLLSKLLEYLTIEEFHKLCEKRMRLEEVGVVKNGVVDYSLVVEILKLAEKDNFLKTLILNVAKKWLQENLDEFHSYVITEEHTEKFKRILKDKAKKTQELRMCYLLRALKDLNWELSPSKLQDYILELKNEESENIARHVSCTLKLFIKEVLKDPVLYNSFKTVKSKENLIAKPLTLEEIKRVAKAIEHLGAKAYFVLLAETGLRPGEVLNLTLDQLDLENRMIYALKNSETKRAYISFFSEKTKEFLINEYLPFREEYIKKYEQVYTNLVGEAKAKEWKKKLFPFKDSLLRAEIYKAMDKVGIHFRLYDLRAFFSSYMSLKKVPGQIIDILQGRVPPSKFKVLVRHYLAFNIEELRKIYDEAGLVVLD